VNDTFQPLKMELATNQPAKPREAVKTGVMTGGSSAVPTIDKALPLDKVQTGGLATPKDCPGRATRTNAPILLRSAMRLCRRAPDMATAQAERLEQGELLPARDLATA